MKTDLELKQIAVDLADGKIFSNRNINEHDQRLMTTIFMPLILGALSKLEKEEMDNIGLIYEYLSEAGPRSINGYPIFTSFHYLKKDDTDKMFTYYKKYKEQKDKFLK